MGDVNGAMHFEGTVDKKPTEFTSVENAAYKSGDVVLFGYDEYVYDGSTWHALGNESIYALKSDVNTTISNLETKFNTAIAKKEDKLSFEGTYNAKDNKVATASYVNSQIATNINALDYSDTGAASGKFVTKVTQTDGVIAVQRAALQASDIPALAISKITGLQTALDGKQATVSFADSYNASTNKAATVATVTNAIAGLDKADTAVAHKFVTQVSETDGIITVARAQPTYQDISGLSTIAHTGNVNNLVQNNGDILVFNCGSATTVI